MPCAWRSRIPSTSSTSCAEASVSTKNGATISLETELSPGRRGVRIDLAQELLESQLRSQHVEIGFHRRIDQRGTAPEGTGLEQREGLRGVAALRVAPGGDDERTAVPVGRSAFPQQRLKAVAFERAGDELRPFRRGHLLSQRHG